MSKLYDAIKRVQESKKSNNTAEEHNTGNGKKPNKKIIMWAVLFVVIIVIGIMVVYITNFISHKHKSNAYVPSNPHSLDIKVMPGSVANDDKKDKANLSKTDNTNAIVHSQKNLTNIVKNVNATQTANSTNSTGVNLKPNIQITQSQSQIIVNHSDNKIHSLNSTKQEQLNDVLNYQQEKAEKLANLAISINHSIESGDYYRAKLLLKQYLSIQEDPFALNDLAAIYIQEGKYAQASELLQKSITQQQSAAAYVNLIYCYKKLHEMDKIKDILKTVNPSIFSEEQKALINNIINAN
jgi:tetratricopeptide (TPR) repeat protein